MTRKGESVAIFLTSPSTSDDDTSDMEENSLSSSIGIKTNIDFGSNQEEGNQRQFEEPSKNTVVEQSSQNTHSTKMLPIDPILILKDRPSKPALKSCNMSRGEDKDMKIRLDCDCISNGSQINTKCNHGKKSYLGLMLVLSIAFYFYFYI